MWSEVPPGAGSSPEDSDHSEQFTKSHILKAVTIQTPCCCCCMIWNNEDVQINLHNCCLIAAAEGDKAAAAPAG